MSAYFFNVKALSSFRGFELYRLDGKRRQMTVLAIKIFHVKRDHVQTVSFHSVLYGRRVLTFSHRHVRLVDYHLVGEAHFFGIHRVSRKYKHMAIGQSYLNLIMIFFKV